MKKLTLTLALVLCLALCVFAFASCGKKGEPEATTARPTPASTTAQATTAEPTTATPTQPPHVHTPEPDYSIDLQPTCTTPGEKSIYCEECGERIEGTTVEIPIDPDAHNVTAWTDTEPVDMFHATGKRSGTCTICLQTIEEDITFEPIIEAFTMTSGQYNVDKVYFADIRNGEHFYPTETNPEGNDLLIEFSILWNETIENFDPTADGYMCGRFDGGKPIYYFSPVAGCPTSDAAVAGAFEWMGNFKTTVSDDEVTTPASMMAPSSNYADYPNIMGADQANPEMGWHRIGIRYHLDLIEGKSGKNLTDYVGTVTVYLDGTAIYKLSTGTLGMQTANSHLFNAETDDGGNVTYTDVDSYIIPFQINRAKTKMDLTAYVALADLYVTCGKTFKMQVEKVASPEAATLEVADGVELPAPIYFKLSES